MSFRFACALLASFFFGFAAVYFQPDTIVQRQSVNLQQRPVEQIRAQVGNPHSAANGRAHAARQSPHHRAGFAELWVQRTSLRVDADQEESRLPPWEQAEGGMPESGWSPLNPEAESGRNDGSPDQQPPQKPASNTGVRIYILYGQYGFPTSSGMYGLAQSLGRYGKVTTHYWDDRTIVSDARQQSGKIVIIGYSLGANSAALIAKRLARVDLVVAYDPSRLSPLAKPENGEYTEAVASSVRRAICFYNPNAWYFGGARLVGSQVETVAINDYHLAVPMNWRLHEITEEAVKKVALESSEPRMEAAISGTESVGSGRGSSTGRSGAAALSPKTRAADANG
jgi:hypothetical protein